MAIAKETITTDYQGSKAYYHYLFVSSKESSSASGTGLLNR